MITGVFKNLLISSVKFTTCLHRIPAHLDKSQICCRYSSTMSQSLKIGTHSGCFHCDEALACYMLKLLPEYQNASIVR